MPALMDPQERADRHRERMARRSRESFSAVAEIGEIHDVVDPARKDACRYSLRAFLERYFPNSTGLKPFSEKHYEAIQRLELAILEGGRFANLFPRGFAKTTVGENAVLWATLYGHRKFIPFFGADQRAADTSIDSLVREITENDLLFEDFGEVCVAFRELEGKPQRCRSQTYQGELTHIRQTADALVFPTIPSSVASGAIIVTRGLTGGSRGMKYKRPDGTQQRPDFVIIDDPQTDDSAASPAQVEKRLRTIKRSILRLGGHNRRIAAVINATMIEEGDLVHQILSDPSWQSMRVKMVEKFSDQHEWWLGEYAKVRQTYDPEDPEDQARAHREATELYAEKREFADAGAVVSWEHCYEEGELSAIQHAYNILIDDGPDVFASECQNEPRRKDEDADALTPKQIMEKLSGYERGVVPPDAHKLTAFVDVQHQILYWMVCAWADQFTGYVVDYGTFPEQRRDYFTAQTLNPTLARTYPKAGVEGAITAGLEQLLDDLFKRRWSQPGGAELYISRCFIDEGDKQQEVHSVCMRSHHKARLYPSKGWADKATHKIPFAEYKKKMGEKTGGGYPWRLKQSDKTKTLMHVLFEPNWWKSFIQSRFQVSKGDPGCLSLFGGEARRPGHDPTEPRDHRLLADHLTAETKTRLHNETTGRTVEQWTLRPEKPDNHWLDCLVGCAVAASLEGVTLASVLPAKRIARRPRMKLSELQGNRR